MRLKHTVLIATTLAFIGCKEIPKEATQQETPKTVETVSEKTASTATYEDLQGNPIELNDYKGKKVLLNYWATWCRPCIEEMPAMERLQTILEKENYVFLFASDQSVSKIEKFKTTRRFDLNFIKFNGALGDEEITALPATFIYNEVGEKVARFDGGIVWDTPEMIEKLKAL